ncbi:MAG: hypothetical protein RLZZ628_3416 [Bacteroidota bacterium]|jgi:hypothetical protein
MHSYKFTQTSKAIAICLQLLSPVACLSATITSTNSGGNWSLPSTWNGGVLPANGDAILIAAGASVTIDDANLSTLSFQSLTISGALTFETTTARSLTINGEVLIDNTGSFQTGATGTVTTHALSIGGNLTNHGILDFSTNNAGASITFTGASNNTFGGSGMTTDILTLVINKGTNASYVLTLTPTVFTVKGSNVNAPAFLTLTNGTIHIAGSYPFSSSVTTGSIVWGSNCGFWLDNPKFSVATTNSIQVDGLFKLTQGTFTVGTTASHSFNVSATTDFVVDGGTLTVSSRLKGSGTVSPMNFTMSGGTINVCKQGNSTTNPSFSMNAKNFTMSGGNIIVNKPAVSNTSTPLKSYSAYAQTINITGGALNCSPTSTGTFKIEGIMPSLIMDGIKDTVMLSNDIEIYGDLTVNSGAVLDLNNYAFYSKGNLVNDGIIKAPFSATDTSKIYLIANAMQTYSGTGIFGTAAAPVASFIVYNAGGFHITSTNNLNINKLYIFSGNITNANKIEIGNTVGLYSLIQYGSSSTTTASGNLDAAPTFNIGSGGLAVLYCKETNSRTIGYEIPPSRVINQLTLMGNTVTLAGGDLNVTSYLQFFSGKINLGNHNLTLESTSIDALKGADNNGYAITNGTGSLTRKSIGNTITWFPVGTTTTYDPVSITNAGTVDDFTVNVSANLDAFAPMPTKYIQRQWNISEATVGGSDVKLSLTCAAGVPTTNFDAASPIEIGHYKSTNVWERIAATMNSSVATANNVTSFSPAPFVIINQSAVLPVELIDFKGIANGKQNILRWATASEKDTKCFIIERSNNSENFKSLDLVATIGHSTQPQFYQWIDNAPNPLSMYRLKIMDLNGSLDYSKVISVENAEGNAMTILPNFGSDEWTVHLTNVPMGAGTLSIFDMQGKLFQAQNIDIQNITTDIKLSINNLLNGNYILICNISGQVLSKKFIKI